MRVIGVGHEKSHARILNAEHPLRTKQFATEARQPQLLALHEVGAITIASHFNDVAEVADFVLGYELFSCLWVEARLYLKLTVEVFKGVDAGRSRDEGSFLIEVRHKLFDIVDHEPIREVGVGQVRTSIQGVAADGVDYGTDPLQNSKHARYPLVFLEEPKTINHLMKFLERLDISQFAPEINKTIRSNRVVVALLVALNVVVYLRTMYTKSWTPFLLLNLLLIVCLSAYLFYRVSMWLHQKVKKDNPENPKLVYRSIAN